MATWFTTLKRNLLYCFFPNRCPFCDKVIAFSEHICKDCNERSTLCRENGTFYPGKCDQVIFCYVYDGAEKESVLRLKYRNRLDVARHLAYFMGEQCQHFLTDRPDVIVPVPMSNPKRKERGFNQAEILAKELSDILNIPMKDILIREHRSIEQHTLSRTARQRAVEGLYGIDPTKSKAVLGKRILLIDDVYTTGNTIKACADVLKKSGAEVVIGAVVCRTFQKEKLLTDFS